MEAKEVGRLDTSYDKLDCQEAAEEDCLPEANQEKQKVSVLMGRTTSILHHQKALIIALAVLASLLLLVDIALGAYYVQLSSAPRTVQDINIEITKMRVSYMSQIQQRDEAKRRLQATMSQKQMKNWEHEHLTKTVQEYRRQADKVETEMAGLRSHLPMLKEGCKHCQPGWIYMSSKCFFYSFSSGVPPKEWREARNYCQRNSATLVVVDNRQKQMAINELIKSSRSQTQTGIWIGLDDLEEEGLWRWSDQTRLVEGFWNDGEPNNHGQENCAEIMLITDNPFKSWNDFKCTYARNWICEMNPMLS